MIETEETLEKGGMINEDLKMYAINNWGLSTINADWNKTIFKKIKELIINYPTQKNENNTAFGINKICVL